MGESMNYIEEIGRKAKRAATTLNLLGATKKNEALLEISKALLNEKEDILRANEKDVILAKENGMMESLIDRLVLNEDRIVAMADGAKDIVNLPDPVGEVLSMINRPNGLVIGQKRVPIGVIGIIYESRPNVTMDAFALCFKAGNAVILRGGSDAIHSNIAIVNVIRKALDRVKLPMDSIQLVADTSRETAKELMRLNKYIDVLIPRGGAGLINTVVQNSTIPVIETGTGNCHIYVDEYADFEMALNIIDNAKTSRLGVCNACESLVIHSKIAEEFIPLLYERLTSKQVEIRACDRAREICSELSVATEEDYYKEYLDNIISLKVVDNIDEAILHINTYNTKHSEGIVTKDYNNAMKFHNEIDAAAVYVNASTRFTDGSEFGYGAEIGISTQKLHARGPMGLLALTTTKYIIFGNGQIR
jgi:glutamate-5-semialdehyde dehydrogenase